MYLVFNKCYLLLSLILKLSVTEQINAFYFLFEPVCVGISVSQNKKKLLNCIDHIEEMGNYSLFSHLKLLACIHHVIATQRKGTAQLRKRQNTAKCNKSIMFCMEL